MNNNIAIENECIEDEIVFADDSLTKTILRNLLTNAIKFTSKGSIQFYLDCEYTSNTTVNISITISDTGIGIAKDKLDTVFESFSQENINNKRKYYGLGLGLYIVKNLINLHGGTLELEGDGKYRIFDKQDKMIEEGRAAGEHHMGGIGPGPGPGARGSETGIHHGCRAARRHLGDP